MGIGQGITLTTYGNAFLKEDRMIDELTLDHPSFRFQKKINFHIIKQGWFSKPHWVEYALNPIEWLVKLKKNGCEELRMVFNSDNSQADDHMLAAFAGGGGHRYIETIFSNNSALWQFKTELTHKNDPENKIWTSSYGRVIVEEKPYQEKAYDIKFQKEKLRQSLQEIRLFATDQNLLEWAKVFQEALDCLEAKTIEEKIIQNKIMPPENMTLPVMQLFASATKAHVFGGMGSWNDFYYKDKGLEVLHNKLSAELYSAVNESYLAVANY
jgi:hypothetical protein